MKVELVGFLNAFCAFAQAMQAAAQDRGPRGRAPQAASEAAGMKQMPGSSRMRRNHGFTLIELMIAIAIIAILTRVAFPSYIDHVTRAKMTEATSNLGALRVNMEQYYQDNRKYNGAAAGACGVAMPATGVKYFTFTCVSSSSSGAGDQQYVITATGSGGGMNGFVYTVDQNNNKTTAIVAPANTSTWGAGDATCWIIRANSC